METRHRSLVSAVVLLVAFGLAPGAGGPALGQAAKAPDNTDRGWPRVYKAGGTEVVLFQPQVDSWEGYKKLTARLAVSVRPKGAEKPEYGVLELEARTETDLAKHVVTMYKPEVRSVRFPKTSQEKATEYEKAVRSISPARTKAEISLERVLAYVKLGEEQKKGITVNLDPPPVFYSDSEAILVIFLGEPRFSKIEDVPLEFGLNTNWDVFRDPETGTNYLLFRDGWLEAPDLKAGPWTPMKTAPKSLKKLPKGGAWDRVAKSVPGKQLESVPRVFVSDRPAELIQTKGRPTFEAVPGTKLSTVSNTQNTLFFHSGESQFYFLAAGRWFRAKDLAGPWTAATTSLPPDFQAIPKNHPKAGVLASVPGTQEADDAILVASIPRAGVVDRVMATVTVTYDGEPKFEPIEKTGVSFAVNTPNDVFQVGSRYYCCFQGVWFAAASPTGPWNVADSVPNEIYSISPTSPKYHVTYVTVVDSTPDTVTCSYTSGYEGEIVSSGVVVYGTAVTVGVWATGPYYWGYYPPYYWGYGYYPPYYGGVTYWTGAYGYGWTAYGPYGGAGYGARYNPATGVYSRGGYAYGPGGGAAWRTGYNPSTGTWAGQRGGYNAYGSWKQGAVTNGTDWARGGRVSNAQGTAGGFRTSGGAAGVGYRGEQGSGFVVRGKEGDIYAGKDGNVYHRDGSGNWSSAGGDRVSPQGSGTRDSLNRDYQARQSGNARASSYQSRGSAGSSRGGGGRRR
ncbi:MAG: hypothetical protein ACM3JH_09930 [Acidithiobacillales bacterium]